VNPPVEAPMSGKSSGRIHVEGVEGGLEFQAAALT
jgi:hypothetical protein